MQVARVLFLVSLSDERDLCELAEALVMLGLSPEDEKDVGVLFDAYELRRALRLYSSNGIIVEGDDE